MTMKSFTSDDGLQIAWFEWGSDTSRPPALLHHGFAASTKLNWEAPGVVKALLDAGRRVVSIDARGHGESDKPTEPRFYGEVKMAKDVSRLIDEIGAAEVDLCGYSMGGIVSLIVGTQETRIRRLIAGGIGAGIVEMGGVDRRAIDPSGLIEALLAPTREGLKGAPAAFRAFAESTGANLKALAAQAGAIHARKIPLETIRVPALVLVGDNDALASRPEVLAAAMPYGRAKVIPGDHLGVVGTKPFRDEIVAFLNA